MQRLALLVTLACFGCGYAIAPPRVRMAPSTPAAHRVLLLPASVPIGVYGASSQYAAQVNQQVGQSLRESARTLLASQGHAVVAELQWDGSVYGMDGVRRAGLDGAEVATLYGAFTSGATAPPALLDKAKRASGADAAFVVTGGGEELPDNARSAKVAKGLVIGIFFVLVIAYLIVRSQASSDAKRASSPVARPPPAQVAAPPVARGVAAPPPAGGVAAPPPAIAAPPVAGSFASSAPRTYSRRSVFGALPLGHVHGPACNVSLAIHDGVYLGAPGPAPEEVPERRSSMLITATLFRLSDGQPLFVADQFGEGEPSDRDFVAALTKQLGQALPVAR